VHFTPLLDFEKLAAPDGPVTYGDTITYTLKLTNLGVRDFENLIVTDTVQTDVPATLEFHDYPQDKCAVRSDITNTITCTVSLTLGGTTDLGFAVTISHPTSALLSAPTSSQDPLAAPTSHITWTQACSPARLEVLGVGISDTLTSTLPISIPETIVSDSIRAQAAFRIIRPGGEVDEVTFCSGGDCYRLTEPTSTCRDSVVYELDVPVSDGISVTFECDDDVRPSGLIAYFPRRTREGHSLVGRTMNQFLYRETYTSVLELPFPRHSGDITVRAIATDNNIPNHVVSLTVQAGERITSTTFSTPSHGNYLDIRELRLSDVPTTANAVTVVAQSPLQNGESFGLVGLIVVETDCRSAPTSIVRVLNRAEACEHVGADRWCWYATYFNTELRVYLPIVLKNTS